MNTTLKNTALIGFNKKGESLHIDGAGGRHVSLGGEVLASISGEPRFDPYSPSSDDRFKEIEEVTSTVLRNQPKDLGGLCSAEVAQVLTKHWAKHLKESTTPAQLARDLAEVTRTTEKFLSELKSALASV